jgi:hypothetical protein
MTVEFRRKIEGYIFLAAFAASIPAANWFIGHVGTVCPPDGPCLLPVAPGMLAPSGVLMVGLALVLRDLLQRRLGKNWTLGAVFAGAASSSARARLRIGPSLLDFRTRRFRCLHPPATSRPCPSRDRQQRSRPSS